MLFPVLLESLRQSARRILTIVKSHGPSRVDPGSGQTPGRSAQAPAVAAVGGVRVRPAGFSARHARHPAGPARQEPRRDNLAIDHEGTQYVIEDLTGGQITMQSNVGVTSGTLCDMVATIGKQPAISLRRLQGWHSQVG
jgi:hypothetical protein